MSKVFCFRTSCSVLENQCHRPLYGCSRFNSEIYKSLDCDGDGILDHACILFRNNSRWLVLSSEGCPGSWGSASRPASKCPQVFGGIVVFRQNIFIPMNLLQDNQANFLILVNP